MLIAPELDRYTDQSALKNTQVSVSKVYDLYQKKDHLVVDYPHEINRITEEMYKQLCAFYTRILDKTDRN